MIDVARFLVEIPFPEINPAIFTIPRFDLGGLGIGPLSLRWYALAYIVGLVLGWRYIVLLVRADRLWKPAQPRPSVADADDFLFWATLGVILGGRLGYVIFYKPDMLWKAPFDVIKVWEGGMAFHGGLIGVALAIFFFARNRKLPMLTLADVAAAATPIGLFFGRLANFINGELYGRPTDAPWGMTFPVWDAATQSWDYAHPNASQVPVHPSQLYEAILEGLVLFFIIRYFTHYRAILQKPGYATGLFLLGYGAFRTFVEFFRSPDDHLPAFLQGWFTLGMAYSIPMIIAGAALIWWVENNHRAAAPPPPVEKPAAS